MRIPRICDKKKTKKKIRRRNTLQGKKPNDGRNVRGAYSHNFQSPRLSSMVNSLYMTLYRVNPWQDCEMTEAGPRDPRRIQFSAHTWRTCCPSRVCVCVHACIFTRVIRTTRWKRMDKEGRGQEPWTTFRLPIRVRSIHVASRLIQGLPIFLYFIRICSCVDCVCRFLEIGLYVCVLAIVEVVKKIGWREREEEVGGILDEWAEKRLLNGM